MKVWFLDNGIRIFPIKYKDKEPACKSWDDFECPRNEMLQFVNYGVVLGLLAVADSDSPEIESWAVQNLPTTPFTVTTGRGRHRYYRLNADSPHFIHRDGHTIEFRHKGQYVVGPGSIHSTGIVYQPSQWSWNIHDIPHFPVTEFVWDDRPIEARGSADGNPFVLPPVIKAGERHTQMFKLMRSLQARGVLLEGLLAACQAENLDKCSPPIDPTELDRYIRRVSQYPDRQGFDRHVQNDWRLIGGIVDTGMSLDGMLAAVRAANPTFDPDAPDPTLNSPPEPVAKRVYDTVVEVEADDDSNLEVIEISDIEEFDE